MLQVGYRSSLKSSQSITDLSNVPEKDNWHTPNRLQSQGISHHTPPYPTTVTTVPNHSTITYPRNFNQFPVQQTSAATSSNNSSYDYLSSIASASNYLTNINNHCGYGFANTNSQQLPLPNSSSVPSNLQLCGCYLKDIARNTSVNVPFGSAYVVPDNVSSRNLTVPSTYTIGDTSSLKIERPRRLKIPEKSSSKFKLHKSLPVSPVSEECRFSDFAQLSQPSATIKTEPRRSFSYFVDLNSKLTTEEGLRQVCSDIQKFSQEFSALSPESKDVSLPGETGKDDDEDGNFSSDSLEECSFTSTRYKKSKKYSPPRRCYSNNEIYNQTTSYEESFVHDPIPKSNTSFYLNPSNRNSRESILSDDYQNDDYNRAKSYCNSLESVLSDDSECKSAPLEVLFVAHRKKKLDPNTGIPYSNSSPIHIASTSQSQYTYDSLPKDYLDNYYTKQNPSDAYQMPQMYNSPEYTSVCASKPNVEPSKHEVSRSKSLGNDVLKTTTYSLNENIENQSPTFKIKKSNTSYEFQQKLLKFETGLSGNDTKPLSTSKHMRENNKKGIAYFIETPKSDKIENKPKSSGNGMSMDIPTLKSKNLQYKSKYCNVLNNKPEVKPETLFGDNSGVPTSSAQTQISTVFQSKENVMKSNTLDSNKLENKRQQRHLETTSLDRHLLSRTLFEAEKIVHKPPKAVRRNSSKSYSKNRTRKLQNNFSENKSCKTPVNFDRNVTKLSTKSDNSSNTSDSDLPDSIENVIELNYKEKNKEIDCEASNKAILSDIYDSLDKLILDTKIEQDSLENLTQVDKQNKEDKYNFWSKSKSVLEAEQKNVWKKYDDFDKINTEKSQANLRKPSNSSNLLNISSSDLDKIQNSIENIKLLHEIQQKVHKINMLVDTFKENMTHGKVKVLSKMYETLSWSQTGLNNLTELSVHATKYKRRNLSLPNFVERNLSTFSTKPSQSTHVCRAQQSNHELRLSKSTNEMSNVLKLAMYNPDLALDPQPKHIPETSKLLADDAGRREPKIGGTVSHNSRASGSKTKAFQILPSKCEGDCLLMRMMTLLSMLCCSLIRYRVHNSSSMIFFRHLKRVNPCFLSRFE